MPFDINQLMLASTVRPPGVAFDKNSGNRQGWAVRVTASTICYQCYSVGKHIAPDCDVNLADLPTIVGNYETLTAEQNSRVPKTAYVMAKRFLNPTGRQGPLTF